MLYQGIPEGPLLKTLFDGIRLKRNNLATHETPFRFSKIFCNKKWARAHWFLQPIGFSRRLRAARRARLLHVFNDTPPRGVSQGKQPIN